MGDKGNRKACTSIEVVIIGAGTGVPVSGYSPACVYVKNNAFGALLDLGPGSLSKLPIYKIDPFTLENILITHLHPDHILDVALFFQLCNYEDAQQRILPLEFYGCKGLKKFCNKMMGLFPDIPMPSFNINYHEMKNDRIEKNGVTISSVLSEHTDGSIAYRLDFHPGSVVYTGDCVRNSPLTDFCANADVLISECSFPDYREGSMHMNATELGLLAHAARVKRLVIVHRYPPALSADLAPTIRQYYAGRITFAHDGTKVMLKSAHKIGKNP